MRDLHFAYSVWTERWRPRQSHCKTTCLWTSKLLSRGVFCPPLLALGIVRSYEIRISYFWIALLLIWTCMLRGYYSSGFKMYLPPSCLVQFVNDISISAANGSWFLFPLWPTGQVRLVTVPFSCYFLRCKAGKSASLLSALLVGGHH